VSWTAPIVQSGLRTLLAVLPALGCMGCEDSTGLSNDSHRLIQTGALEYNLEWDGIGFKTEIPYTFSNRTRKTIYLTNCGGQFGLYLERKADTGWERKIATAWKVAWAPVINDCLSEPIVIEKGATFFDTLWVWGALPGHNVSPTFDVEDPSGTYRIVWARPAFRSNQFRLRR